MNKSQNLCGTFTKGTAKNPNWLQDGWTAIFLDLKLQEKFDSHDACWFGFTTSCCKKLWYKYAGVPIGVKNISKQRKAAEFLASKGYINTKNLNPDDYNLSWNISRREFIKIIMKASEKKVTDKCERIFQDSPKDWGCNYIESALENNFIAENLFFRPEAPVSELETIKLTLKARNIQKKYDTGYWREDYISTAYYLGFINNKSEDYNRALTRGEAFSIIASSFPDFRSY